MIFPRKITSGLDGRICRPETTSFGHGQHAAEHGFCASPQPQAAICRWRRHCRGFTTRLVMCGLLRYARTVDHDPDSAMLPPPKGVENGVESGEPLHWQSSFRQRHTQVFVAVGQHLQQNLLKIDDIYVKFMSAIRDSPSRKRCPRHELHQPIQNILFIKTTD